MKIRSITTFAKLRPGDDTALRTWGDFLRSATAAVVDGGYEVQTVRLALPPMVEALGGETSPAHLRELAQWLDRRCGEVGIDYVALGPLRPGDPPGLASLIPELLGSTERVFLTMEIASSALGLDLRMARTTAELIVRNAPLRPDGFANLRFAALANVPPLVPFLPAAYHDGGPAKFAFATEAADLARTAFDRAPDPGTAIAALEAKVEEHAGRLESIALSLEGPRGTPTFAGIDFSLAPFPRHEDSICAALESSGLEACGAPGSVAAAALISSALDRARFPRVGFSGLFLPVMEDVLLARRAAQQILRVEDLLLLSCVCGTGLDTIPLPGSVSPASIEMLLLDLSTLALRLNKPLTARLMPMPGKEAGDELSFEFPYFAEGRVMSLRNGQARGWWAQDAIVPIVPRPSAA